MASQQACEQLVLTHHLEPKACRSKAPSFGGLAVLTEKGLKTLAVSEQTRGDLRRRLKKGELIWFKNGDPPTVIVFPTGKPNHGASEMFLRYEPVHRGARPIQAVVYTTAGSWSAAGAELSAQLKQHSQDVMPMILSEECRLADQLSGNPGQYGCVIWGGTAPGHLVFLR